MPSKVFERLVTKFSIKVADLVKYLEVSKATIYNYRNLENFADIPKDKQYKIFYLFGKEDEKELELVLDESDPDILAGYVSRISSILSESVKIRKESLASVEELTAAMERLMQENTVMKRQVSELDKFEGIDEFTRAVLFDKLATIVEDTTPAEMKEFMDYLDIFEKYRMATRKGECDGISLLKLCGQYAIGQ